MLFEWLFERRNRGPVGTIENDPPESWDGHAGLLRGLAALGLLVWFAWWIAEQWPEAPDRFTALVVSVVYLAVAYRVSPRPNMHNVGLWGTPINHPFRFTDDLNRMLWFIQIVLWPGRFVAVGIVDLIHLARSTPRY